jgi:hypothetical protein
MDGVSAAASIIEVLRLAGAVIALCYDFRAAWKDAPRQLTHILEEVAEVRNILEKLERLCDRTAASQNVSDMTRNLSLLCQPQRGPIAVCDRELLALYQLLQKCMPPGRKDSKRRAIKETFWSWFKEDEVQGHLLTLGRCKATLGLALTADNTYGTEQIPDASYVLTNGQHAPAGCGRHDGDPWQRGCFDRPQRY